MTADYALVVADRPLASIAAAREHAAKAALARSQVGAVGLELELHLVDRARPSRRISWPEIGALLSSVPPLPGGSAVTVEPGGQLELSTPPRPNVVAAIAALERDHRLLNGVVRAAGYGLASIGADPARVARRVNPSSRYVAMERHFDALACGGPGRAMMSATAALQINLNAGPKEAWAERVRHVHRIGPVLVALSACSPLVAGRSSGWRSMRQEIWGRLDQARCRPLHAADPAEGWARYALAAPVMLLRDPATGATTPVTDRIPFADWVSGQARLGHAPTADDLDYHLSTLFPPVRLRGGGRPWPRSSSRSSTTTLRPIGRPSCVVGSTTRGRRRLVTASVIMRYSRPPGAAPTWRRSDAQRPCDQTSRPTPSWSGLAVRLVTNYESAHGYMARSASWRR
jgi:ergothioneine biosynthesis glutamate--cysteine ligase EgtA